MTFPSSDGMSRSGSHILPKSHSNIRSHRGRRANSNGGFVKGLISWMFQWLQVLIPLSLAVAGGSRYCYCYVVSYLARHSPSPSQPHPLILSSPSALKDTPSQSPPQGVTHLPHPSSPTPRLAHPNARTTCAGGRIPPLRRPREKSVKSDWLNSANSTMCATPRLLREMEVAVGERVADVGRRNLEVFAR